MTSYITITTYINYEKVAANLINEYDVDAELNISENSNKYYKTILENYITTSGSTRANNPFSLYSKYSSVSPEVVT